MGIASEAFVYMGNFSLLKQSQLGFPSCLRHLTFNSNWFVELALDLEGFRDILVIHSG